MPYADKDEYKAYQKWYKETYKNELKIQNAEYYQNNKDEIKARKKEYESRLERIEQRRKQQKEKRKEPKVKKRIKKSNKKYNSSEKGKATHAEAEDRRYNEVLEITAEACICKYHKGNKKKICCCCGKKPVKRKSWENEQLRVWFEHRFPRQVYNILYPTYTIAFKELGISRESHKVLKAESASRILTPMKMLNKSEINIWFGLLCIECNNEVFRKGTCKIGYVNRNEIHTYKSKSSKRIDEFLDSYEYKYIGILSKRLVKSKYKLFFERRKKSRG